MIVNWKTAVTADYWKAERLIMRATGVSAAVHFWTATEGSYANPIAIYSADAQGVCEIDVTDYIRTYGNKTLKFAESSLNVYSVSVSVRGLIDPRGVIIPAQEDTAYALVVPPFKIIDNEFDWGHFGFFSDRGADIQTYIRYRDGDDETDESTGAYPPLCDWFMIMMEWEGQAEIREIVRHIEPRMCNKEYAEVRWVDFMGQTRCHTFEVVKLKTEGVSEYSLLNINNEYSDVRGRNDGFTIRLDGLCRYDIWYYSDIATSSKVEVSLGNQKYYLSQVTTKSVTLPDGENGNGRIEFNVNWRKYDAVTM